MHREKRMLLAINIIGGIAVLGSYAWGLLTHSNSSSALWGSMPASLRQWSTAWMPAAAIGYFLFLYLLLFRTNPDEARVAGRFGFGAFNALFVLILAPSVAWMPLTFAALANPSAGLLWAVRAVLWLVGLGALGLVAALATLRPRGPAIAHVLAVLGSVLFAVQTVLNDAILWVIYFRP